MPESPSEDLMSQIDSSQETSPEIKENTIKLLKQANSILDGVTNPELKNKFQKNYENVRQEIIKALQEEAPWLESKAKIKVLNNEIESNNLNNLDFSEDVNWIITQNEFKNIEQAFKLFSSEVITEQTREKLNKDPERYLNIINNDTTFISENITNVNDILNNSDNIVRELVDIWYENDQAIEFTNINQTIVDEAKSSWNLSAKEVELLDILVDHNKQKVEKLKADYENLQSLVEQDFSWLDDDFFIENPEYIYLITDVDRLQNLITISPEPLSFKNINPDIIENNPELIFDLSLEAFDFKNIPSDFLISNIERFLKNFKNLSQMILLRAVEVWESRDKLKQIIRDNNIQVSDTVKNYLNPGEMSIGRFDDAYEEFLNWNISEENRDIINQYLINNDLSKYEDQIINLIENWLLDWHTDLLFAKKTLNISIALVQKSPAYITFIPNTHLKDPILIEAFFHKDNDPKEIEGLLHQFKIDSIKTLCTIYRTYKKNHDNHYQNLLLNPQIKFQVQDLLSNSGEELYKWFSSKEDKKAFSDIIKEFDWIDVDIKAASENLQSISSSMEESEKDSYYEWVINIISEKFSITLDKDIIQKIESWTEQEKHSAYKELIEEAESDEKAKSIIDSIISLKIEDLENQKSKRKPKLKDKLKLKFRKKLTKKEEEKLLKGESDEFKKAYKEEKELTQLSQQKNNFNAHYEYIKNWDFEKSFDEYLIEYKEKEETLEQKKELDKNNYDNYSNTNNNINNNYRLNTLWDKPELLWNNWEKIEITPDEAMLVKNNPEAINNLVNFHNFFKKLNLESIWDYRKELATTIWNINIDFNDANSVSKSELLSFWNKLIKAINWLMDDNENLKDKSKLSEVSNLWALQNEFRKFSGAWSMMSDNMTSNIEWEDKFASTLRQFWVIWWTYFNIHLLREKMN